MRMPRNSHLEGMATPATNSYLCPLRSVNNVSIMTMRQTTKRYSSVCIVKPRGGQEDLGFVPPFYLALSTRTTCKL